MQLKFLWHCSLYETVVTYEERNCHWLWREDSNFQRPDWRLANNRESVYAAILLPTRVCVQRSSAKSTPTGFLSFLKWGWNPPWSPLFLLLQIMLLTQNKSRVLEEFRQPTLKTKSRAFEVTGSGETSSNHMVPWYVMLITLSRFTYISNSACSNKCSYVLFKTRKLAKLFENEQRRSRIRSQ